jgi:2-phosphosulfolactate phosphatase
VEFHRATLATCSLATGLVVAIDVLRAFSTAAFALAAGASDILLVAEVEQAFGLQQRFPDSLLTGEVNGLPIAGFDFGNSPVEISRGDLRGRRLVQRTTAGTRGVVNSASARQILAASFACAGATARFIQRLGCEDVTFVITGAAPDERFDHSPIARGDEDAACADYLEALLRGQQPDSQPYLQRVRLAPAAEKFIYPDQADFSPEDLAACTAIDRFDFAMPVERQGDLLVLKAVAA